MITSWITFKSQDNYLNTLIEVLNNSNPFFELVYKLGSTSTVQYHYKGTVNSFAVPSLGRNKWFFLKLQIRMSVSSDDVNVMLYTSGSSPGQRQDVISPPPVGFVDSFYRSSMSINLGYSKGVFGTYPSCSLIRNSVIYLNPQPWTDSIVSTYHTKESTQSQLQIHYDFFNSQNNQKYLISSGTDQSRAYSDAVINPDPRIVEASKKYISYYIDDIDEDGFIMYIEFLIPISIGNPMKVLGLKIGTQDFMSIRITSGQKPTLYVYDDEHSFGMALQLHKWYQVFIVYQIFPQEKVLCFLQDGSNLYTGQINVQNANAIYQIYLGSSVNTYPIYIDNARVYKGSFITETSTCQHQVVGYYNQCLICQSGYLLSYQDGMKCISGTGITTLRDNILDWNRTQCGVDMIYLPSGCQCRNQYYLFNTGCQLCPDYCQNCTSENNCIIQDKNRNNLGECNPGYFDEGYYCIDQTYQILYINNFQRIIPSIGSASEYLFWINLDLQWSKENSFFLSFFISNLLPVGVNFQQILGFIRDSGIDYFSITISYDSTALRYDVCFYFKGILSQCFMINPLVAWIGIWTDFLNVIYFVGSQGQTLFSQQTLAGINIFLDPTFCVGKCTLLNPNAFTTYQGQFPNRLLIIQGMTSPSLQIEDLFLLKGDQAICISYFNSISAPSGSSPTVQNSIKNYSPSQSLVLQFSNISKSLLKGFYLPTNHVGTISSILFGNELSIALIIKVPSAFSSFDPSDQFLPFFQYSVNGYSVKYNLVYKDNNGRIFFRICLNLTCRTTKKAFFKLNEYYFLAVLMRDLDPPSTEVSYYEFEVVCEFKREKLRFHLPFINQLYQKTSISFPSSNLPFNINSISLFIGTDFYFDYSSLSNCFLSYNIVSLQCLKAKEGYATYQGKVVKDIECTDYSKGNEAVIFNQYTKECLKISTNLVGCFIYNDRLTACNECFDPNAQLSNCDICMEGYFKNSESEDCQPCHQKCKTCINYDVCLICNDQNSSPPYCECISPYQYQNENYTCLQCSPKCSKCKGSSIQCSLCFSDRINPPTCDCNPQLYDLKKSNDSYCSPLDCEPQCDNCEYSTSNCINCAFQRVNLPICSCEKNFYESQGNCQQCPSNHYYNQPAQSCLKCDKGCYECQEFDNKCTSCLEGFILVDNTCMCSKSVHLSFALDGTPQCIDSMNVSVELMMINSDNNLVFTFDENLSNMDFTDLPIESLIYIYITSIPQNSFSISNSKVENGQLIVTLSFEVNFRELNGNILFLQTTPFVSQISGKIIDYKYLTTPLTFKIGPCLQAKGGWQPSSSQQSALQTFKSMNSFFFTLCKQLQVVFSFLNTLQPCVIFLMIKIILPPNLYQYLQMIGILIFPDVADYGVTVKDLQFSFLGISLEQDQDYSENRSTIFQRFSLSNCLIINIPIAIAQCILWPFLYFIINEWQDISLSRLTITKMKKYSSFILNQLNSNMETSLLLITTGILNQFFNVDQDQYLNRMSIYLSILITILLIYFNIQNYQKLQLQFINNNGGLNEDNPHLSLIEKLDFMNRFNVVKNYYFYQCARKYMIAILVVFLEDYPSQLCLLCSLIFFTSLTLTALIRPFKSILGNVTKIIGESCLLVSWIIFYIKIVPFQQIFKQEAIISSEKVAEFIFHGNIVLISLAILNSIYLIEFLWIQIISKIMSAYSKSRKSQNIVEKEMEEIVSFEEQHKLIFFKKKQIQSQNISVSTN